jgi:hydrogenase maturation protease
MSRPRKILVAGIGNIFFGDDGFGSEVARRLITEALPPEVSVIDFGIRSYDLAYAMMDGYEVTILVDATAQGKAPGTVFLIEPDLTQFDESDVSSVDAHTMNPSAVFRIVYAFRKAQPEGGEARPCHPGKYYLVGCEPAMLEAEEGQIGLSEQVAAAVPRAIALVRSLVTDLLK